MAGLPELDPFRTLIRNTALAFTAAATADDREWLRPDTSLALEGIDRDLLFLGVMREWKRVTRELDAARTELAAARAQLQTIGRKAFWAARREDAR